MESIKSGDRVWVIGNPLESGEVSNISDDGSINVLDIVRLVNIILD